MRQVTGKVVAVRAYVGIGRKREVNILAEKNLQTC